MSSTSPTTPTLLTSPVLPLASATGIPLSPTPPRFTGSPAESSTQFACKLSLLVSYAHTSDGTPPTDQAKVVYTSLFLDGDAHEWFINLTLANAEKYIEEENKRRREIGWPLLEQDEGYPPSWVNFPFVTEESKTLGGFLRAVMERWPVRKEGGKEKQKGGGTGSGREGRAGWVGWLLESESKIRFSKQA